VIRPGVIARLWAGGGWFHLLGRRRRSHHCWPWARRTRRVIPTAWRFRAPLAPAFRRGLLAAVPVTVAFVIDLKLDLGAAGAVSTGALLSGFVAFDAPGRSRFAWQILTAPAIGAAAALGALTSEPGALAVVAMWLFASAAGLLVAVSPRLYLAGLVCVLALLLAQGLAPTPHVALKALLLGAGGAALQALFSLATSPSRPPTAQRDRRDALRRAGRSLAASFDFASPSLRHALRSGAALAAGVAAYHVVDLGVHGYWIPLTVLFVLRPGAAETVERIAMRALGTVLGLLAGTPLAILLGGSAFAEGVAIWIAAALSFALLAIEYALFTTAMTGLIVLLSHALGQSALQAADERAVATLLGIVIVATFVALWSVRIPRPT
jgi:Fusaric acid resistance protein-like